MSLSRPPRCAGGIRLDDSEVAFIKRLPGSGHQVARELWCELHPDHTGPRFALAQSSWDDHWWVRWTNPNERELIEFAYCPFKRTGPDDLCMLPMNHEGNHRFE